MKFQIESGVQLIKRSNKPKIVKKPLYPINQMMAGESIIISKNKNLLIPTYYKKKYQTIYSNVKRIKQTFNVNGSFKIGLDQNNYLRILKIS